ncbi:hypothetical protein J2X69_004902 [Algoriphagus sp. 4150]|nr:hypothetical protein [Algoriphagus sp. 4150]
MSRLVEKKYLVKRVKAGGLLSYFLQVKKIFDLIITKKQKENLHLPIIPTN